MIYKFIFKKTEILYHSLGDRDQHEKNKKNNWGNKIANSFIAGIFFRYGHTIF